MRVLVIGSTGTLGRPAVRRLLADGHQVTGLARNEERAAAVAKQGITPAVADLFDAESLATVLPGHEAVLNLATRIPPAGKALLGMGWAENDHIRVDGSAALVTAALASADVRVVVQEGVAFYYADGGDTELTEESPVDVTAQLRSSVIAHENVARFTSAGGGRVGVALRIAALHGDDPLTRALLRSARLGLPVVYGDPMAWTTVIHPSDAATGAVAALSAPAGVYNVGATPLRKRDLGAVIAEAAGARRARTLQGGRVLRRMSVFAAFARSLRVVSTKLTDATGWQPTRPTPAVDWFEPA
jgi:nucleoside-diphosphate-sugar epimerase